MAVTGFFAPPESSRYALRRVHVPAGLLTGTPPAPAGHDDLVLCDLVIDDGMVFGLQCAWAKGVVAIRTHLDSGAPQPAITFPVFRQLRDEWAGRIELQP